METPYREAARRRARKEKALQERRKKAEALRERKEKLRAREAASAARRRKAAASPHGQGRPAGAAGASASKSSHAQAFVDPRASDNAKVCPHCRAKLVRVMCLQKPVLACVQCRGISLSGEVVKQFAAQGGWFSQLDAAVSLYARGQAVR